MRMYRTNFRQPTAHVQQNISGKTLKEMCIPHLYASFGTFWVQIGQLCESFEVCLKIDKPLWTLTHSLDTFLDRLCSSSRCFFWYSFTTTCFCMFTVKSNPLCLCNCLFEQKSALLCKYEFDVYTCMNSIVS